MTLYDTIIQNLRSYSVLTVIIRLILAVICGGLIGFERERHGRTAGLRTHIMVCLGAAITTLIGAYSVNVLGVTWADPMRIGAQVVSGISFLGMGTIISKGRFQVTGLTTAAGLWATAIIGLAIGAGFYEGGITASFLTIITMTLLTGFDSHIIKKSRKFRIYIEVNDVNAIMSIVDSIETLYKAHDAQVTVPRSGISGNAGIEVTVRIPSKMSQKQVLAALAENNNIVYAMPSI